MTNVERDAAEYDSDDAVGPRGPLREPQTPFPIVGIGASAGGLEALTQLVGGLSSDSGMAFVLVQHLDPRHESRLAELLGRHTAMPVLEATHGMPVERDHVYVIPPNTNLALGGGVLHLTPRGDGHSPHAPIDYLFRSLAVDQQERSIAVVLSGTGSDGTQGVCEIKAVGGITFAQDELTAGHSGMPRSAAASGCVDFVLEPGRIAERLVELGDHPYLVRREPLPEAAGSAADSYRAVLTALRDGTGVDFTLYRDSTIRRRILRRMALHTERSLAEYARKLENDPAEVDALYHDLLINVTSFFRDSELFESLKKTVFPVLAERRLPNQPFRIWVPGCSTGQEAYSLAMALVEFFDSRPVAPPMQIFATDLSDQRSLDRARAGVYPEGIENEVSPERLRRFFRREDHSYRIDKTIRDSCVFARQNVTTDPPFSHVDLISCRNLLIYLQTPLQKRIVPMFHYALNTPGFLVLGSAETIGEYTDLFELADPTHRIYSKKPSATRHQAFFSLAAGRAGVPAPRRLTHGPTLQEYQRETDRILLGRYAPPGVLVDENFDVLQFRGRTSDYLEAPSGEPTTNVLKLAREGLLLELRNALTEAAKHARRVRRDDILMRSNGALRQLAIEVVPVQPPGGANRFLVLFLESSGAKEEAPPPEPNPASAVEEVRELVQVRQELSATREYVQSILEQQDAANEELRSANEEILSSNEELQSTNEELETAKEELQSVNEELTTVNEQLQRRNNELDRANNDLTNLLTSTNLPLVMVGPDLRVRRVTPPARRVMNVLPTDVDRPLGEIKLAAVSPDIEQIVAAVIETVQPQDREVQDREGRWYSMRVFPYRTADHRIDGAVILLIDIHERRMAEETLQRQSEAYRQQGLLIELSQDAVVIRDGGNKVTFWNRGAQEMYGWGADEVKGQLLDRLLRTDAATWKALNQELDERGAWEGELRQARRDGTPIVVHSREVLVHDENGERQAVLAINRDVTQLKRVIDALKEADQRKDEFLAVLAHELRNPLAPIRNAAAIMRWSGDDPAAVARVRETLDRQTEQLSRIVEDLVDVSRIVEGKIELRKERVRLARLVETAVEASRSLLDGAGHRLSVTLPDEPLYLEADPIRIAQVVTNLLNNAAKFTDAGGQVWLSAERVDGNRDGSNHGHGEVVLRVRDTGIGIQPDLLPKVFEIFTQGHRTEEQGRGGLGVGLSLVRSLVHMHGGTVQAHSAGPGLGSEFVVRLPLADASLAEESHHGTTIHGSEGEMVSPAVASHPRRVLVVDDSTDQADTLGLLLELMGHEVRVAYAGATALEIAASFEPDVALVDIGLPDFSGYELARRLRAEPRFEDMLLIAQTGWGQKKDRRRSKDAGFDHHLVKPVDADSLEQLLSAPAKR